MLGLVGGVVVVLARLKWRGRQRRHYGGGADGFHPQMGERGDGRHGDLDELVSLDEPDECFEAIERRLSVSLHPEESIPLVHADFERLVEVLVLLLQVSALLLQLVVPPQQPPLLLLSHCLVCNVGLNKVLRPRQVLLVQHLLLALGAVPGASVGSFNGRVEAVGVEGSGAVVAEMQLSVFLTDGAAVVMLQLLLKGDAADVSSAAGRQ